MAMGHESTDSLRRLSQDASGWGDRPLRDRGADARRWLRLAVFVAVSLCLGSHRVAAQQQWPSERPPRPLAARDVKFPPYQIQTLPNGLKVVAVAHHEQPAVSMRLLVRAGSALDPKDKLGLVHELASLLDQGTRRNRPASSPTRSTSSAGRWARPQEPT